MAKITNHEAMPFPLDKPNPETFVTEGEKIGWGDKPLTQAINEKNDAKSSVGNSNATTIEGKVNALIDIVLKLVSNTVFHAGVPFATPKELKSKLELLRYSYSGAVSSPAICGQAICGQTICGAV